VGERTEAIAQSVREALSNGQLEEAGRRLTAHYGGLPIVEIQADALPTRPSVVKWCVAGNMTVVLNQELPAAARGLYAVRLLNLLPLLIAYHRSEYARGSIYLNLGDAAAAPGLALCSNRGDNELIPDPEFIRSRGYLAIRENLSASAPPWSARRSMAVWRGAIANTRQDRSWRMLPRVREPLNKGGLDCI
jgi:hypothetical protein